MKSSNDYSTVLLYGNLSLLLAVLVTPLALFSMGEFEFSNENSDWRSGWYSKAEQLKEPSRLLDMISGCLNFSSGQDSKFKNAQIRNKDTLLSLCGFAALIAALNLAIAVSMKRRERST